ncbi:MAG: L-histidine N(alpha)-methyltransferase [Gemmatimonadales bacterium]
MPVVEWDQHASNVPAAAAACRAGGAPGIRQIRAALAGAGDARRDALEFATDVWRGLTDTPRWIPSRWLYDEQGSGLFEEICELPEYYLTRTEAGILQRLRETIVQETGPVTLVEFGAGDARKTDLLLEEYLRHGHDVGYLPVDVSSSALDAATKRITTRFPRVRVTPVVGSYEAAFAAPGDHAPVMLVFLGSTFGNMDAAAAASFWTAVSQASPAGTWFLLGVDLVKGAAEVEAAYNDQRGVSAAFTRNLFARMNRELATRIDLDALEHVARWNHAWCRVEIGARFTRAQVVELDLLGRVVPLEAGAFVLTEISRKFHAERLSGQLSSYGWSTVQLATDPERRYAVLLLRRDAPGARRG